MIRSHLNNYEQQCNIFMNFDNIKVPDGRPSDCDLWYIGRDYMILGEIKNYSNMDRFETQKFLYEKAVNHYTGKNAIALLIGHNKFVQNGDTEVDVAKCRVVKYYMKGLKGWHEPQVPLTVNEIIQKLLYEMRWEQ